MPVNQISRLSRLALLPLVLSLSLVIINVARAQTDVEDPPSSQATIELKKVETELADFPRA